MSINVHNLATTHVVDDILICNESFANMYIICFSVMHAKRLNGYR